MWRFTQDSLRQRYYLSFSLSLFVSFSLSLYLFYIHTLALSHSLSLSATTTDVATTATIMQVLYSEDGESVCGIATKDVGIAKDGTMKDTFTRGIELRARHTLFAEGCRGSCSEEVRRERERERDRCKQRMKN